MALAVGFALTRLAPGAPIQRISDGEYTAVVAQLFLRDHNAALARERLSAIGTPSDMVQKAIADAQAGRTATPNDRVALDALSAALLAPTATATTDGAPTASGASSTSTTDPETSLSWIGPLVAFFLALGLGFLVLARTAGLSISGLRLPWVEGPGQTRASTTPAPRRSTVVPYRSSETGRPSSVSISEIRLDSDVDDSAPRTAVSRASSVRRARSAAATATRPRVFESNYRAGDDPFEEIHPVADPRTGGLIAACGLTATLRLDSIRSGGYYAFTAWIQDYAGGDELHAAGLVAPGATEIARSNIDSWVRSGQVDAVLSLERGATTVVGTDDVKATISVVDVSYGNEERVSDAYVTALTVRFEIHQSDQDDDADA